MSTIYANAMRAMQALRRDHAIELAVAVVHAFRQRHDHQGQRDHRIFGTTATPQSSLANEMWNTCQSHAGQNSNNFLPWHRMFVFFFEQIIREVSGRADFALPYWDYTSADPLKRGILPIQFRCPTDPVFGVLYRPDRTSLANSGQPIDKNQPADQMDIARRWRARPTAPSARCRASAVRSIRASTAASTSWSATSKNMGAVPYAARDPLFWVHHSTIDRMWASWNANGGVNPDDRDLGEQAVRVRRSHGQRVSGRLKDYFDTAHAGLRLRRADPAPLRPAPRRPRWPRRSRHQRRWHAERSPHRTHDGRTRRARRPRSRWCRCRGDTRTPSAWPGSAAADAPHLPGAEGPAHLEAAGSAVPRLPARPRAAAASTRTATSAPSTSSMPNSTTTAAARSSTRRSARTSTAST